MNRTLVRWSVVVALAGLCAFAFFSPTANAKFIENFDVPGVPYTLTNSSGSPPVIDTAGGTTGSFVRLTNLDGSNNNSIAWDEDPTQTGPSPGGLRLAFDFRMSGDAANTAAGGCCDSAADGIGIGLYSTATYGATGASNPAVVGGSAWETPANADSFAVGLDVFQNIDVVNLNWGGAQVAEADVQGFLDLNDGQFHRAVVTLTPSGSDAVADMTIIQDVQGSTMLHQVFSGQLVSGLDLAAFPGYRVIAGGRTGGAFVDSSLDNIAVVSIPEPTAVVLLGLGGFLLLVARRRVF